MPGFQDLIQRFSQGGGEPGMGVAAAPGPMPGPMPGGPPMPFSGGGPDMGGGMPMGDPSQAVSPDSESPILLLLMLAMAMEQMQQGRGPAPDASGIDRDGSQSPFVIGGRDAGDVYDYHNSNGDPGLTGLFGSNPPDLRQPPPGVSRRRGY